MSIADTSRKIRRQAPNTFEPEHHLALTFDVTPGRYFLWKSIPDRIAATLLLIPALPIIGLLIIAVRLTSRGPGIFRQIRTGKHGQPFTMLKIRTMVTDAEAGTGAVWAKRNDPRVTWLGKILRKLHLDEFPQLFNVLRGEMAFVGPRPERPEFVTVLSEAIPGYQNRLAILPGITGLAQINLPPDSDLDSVRRKLALDLAYIEEAGPWLDTRMFVCTVGRVLGIPGVLVTLLFGLRRHVLETTHHHGCLLNAPANGHDSGELLTPAKLTSATKTSVAKISMAQAIGARLSASRAASINGNGKANGNGHSNGNGNGKPLVIAPLRDRSPDADVALTPYKPR
ncbi:MAG: sugar transferase [Pirellulaceae bacterium]